MLNLDPGKLLVIAIVAIILLGPDRLPQVARQVGAAWRSFNEFRHRMETEVRSSIPDMPSTSEIARLARSPSALLDHLSNLSDDAPPGGTAVPAGQAPAETPAAGADPARTDPPGTNGHAGTDAAEGDPIPPRAADPPAPPPAAAEVVVPGDPNLN